MKKIRIFLRPQIFKLLCMCFSLAILIALCMMPGRMAEETGGGTVYTVSQGEARKEDVSLQLYAQAAVLMDADSGRVLYSKNGDETLPMASTTKILTCILALERGNPEDEVTVSAYASTMPKVKLYVQEGERYRLQDLLYSLMLESHNDSAVAIAEHIGGSVEGFAQMMNEKALEIGWESSFFLTPNGLDAQLSENGAFHSTTASDLARIMAYCVNESEKKEEFLQITQTQDYAFTNSEGRSFSCHNHNALLTMMEGCISGKTGFTNKAGYCYVGAVKRDERTFTVALLACGWPNNKSYKWADCRTLFGYGFEKYQYRDVYEKQEFEKIPVTEGIPMENDPFHEAFVEISQGGREEELRFLLKDTDQVEIRCFVPERLEAPVTMGTEIGSVVYTVNGEVMKTYPVITIGEVARQDQAWFTKYIIEKFLL